MAHFTIDGQKLVIMLSTFVFFSDFDHYVRITIFPPAVLLSMT
jgi:hypothetical protein